MNKDKMFVIVVVVLLVLGVVFLCISMFGDNQENHHPLPIALCCIFSANALVIVRNKKRNKR